MAFRGWAPEPSRRVAASSPPSAVPAGGVTYRMGWGYSVYMWAAALLCAVGAVAAAMAEGAHESGASRTVAAAGFATFAALAMLAAMGMRRTRLTIDATGIEWVEFGKPRRLLLEQIRGYRVLRVQAGTYLVFEPRQADMKRLRIPHIGNGHEAFLSWLSQIPVLNAGGIPRP